MKRFIRYNESMNFLFIDVDGTLLSDKGIIPDSAKYALAQAKDRGHKLFLSTGRALTEIVPEIHALNFDGMVICGGNTVYLNDKLIFDQVLSASQLSRLVEYFTQRKIPFYCEANSGLYASRDLKAFLDDRMDNAETYGIDVHLVEALKRFMKLIIFDQNVLREDVNKISFAGSDHPIEELMNDLSEDFVIYNNLSTVFGKNSGEITLKGSNKAVGIRKILENFPNQKIVTYGFGDGHNDLEMFDEVEVAIAMGNAVDAVKAKAHFVTKAVLEDGLAFALKHLNLI